MLIPFPNDVGGLIDYSNFRRGVFNKIIRKLKLHGKRITPHSFPQTFASLHLGTGSNQLWVRRQGGWKSLSVLLDTCTPFMPSELGGRGFADALTAATGACPKKRHVLA